MRRWIGNLLLLGASLLLAAALGELWLRLTDAGSVYPFVQVDRSLYVRKPFFEYLNLKENRNLVRYNNLGFHDRVRSTSAPDQYRILVIGDSYVEAPHVPRANLLTSHLERRFRRSGRAVEVINAGMVGVGTAYEYLLWKRYLRQRLEINHLVLLMYLGNDVENNHQLLSREVLRNPPSNLSVHLDRAGRPYLDLGTRTRLQQQLLFMRRHSALVNTLAIRFYLFKLSLQGETEKQPSPAQTAAAPDRHELAAAWQEATDSTLELLRRWHDELQRSGAAFSIVVLPPMDPRYDRDREAFRTGLRELCSANRIELLELKFGGRDPNEVLSFDEKILGHLNPLGHHVVATKIYEWLMTILPENVGLGPAALRRGPNAAPGAVPSAAAAPYGASRDAS